MAALSYPDFFDSRSPDLQRAAVAARVAGKIIRNGYDQLHQIEAKGIGDLVSEIDRQADRAAAEILNAEDAPRPILSEEISPELSGRSEEFWIVDPLDGTSAFLFKTGIQFSSVIIALRKANQTTLAVVYFPLTDEWFHAETGQGAFRNGQPLRCDPESRLGPGWVELNAYSDSSLETAEFARLRDQLRTARGAALVTQNAPYSGVAMRIADPQSLLVACVHDNQARSVKQAAWDIAGPQLILEEAGGACLNLRGQRVDPFTAETFIVACNRHVAQQILDLLS